MAALSFMFLLDRLAHWEPEEETARGRGGFVKRIDFAYHEMGVLDEGNYKTHVDNHYDPNALPVIQGINYRDVVTNNVLMVARLEGIEGDPFTRIWISNVTIGMTAKAKNVPLTCTDIDGITSGVSPCTCGYYRIARETHGLRLFGRASVHDQVVLKSCTFRMNYM
ncbi:probable polygalacturonase [Hibiscus syriacus]|uniref:probable polygalacturonase n=1 Tax=Hibiscus syriacus TaxID=106335 RepID=UPI0019246855|nr:probable polygalacturonase [Hibiscus syriacus]